MGPLGALRETVAGGAHVRGESLGALQLWGEVGRGRDYMRGFFRSAQQSRVWVRGGGDRGWSWETGFDTKPEGMG